MVTSCLSKEAEPGTFRFTGIQIPQLNVFKIEFLTTLKLLELLQRGLTGNEFVLQHSRFWFCFHRGATKDFRRGGILFEAPMAFLCIFAINAVWYISVLRERGSMHETLKVLGLIRTHTVILHSGYTTKSYCSSLKHWLCGEPDQADFTDHAKTPTGFTGCWIQTHETHVENFKQHAVIGP